jgi:ribonuclease E
MRPEKARHDVGRISRLGLLEISRQRLRPAAVASSYTACPMCEGHGSVRTAESAALGTLRKIHNRVAEGDIAQLTVTLPRDVAMYLLNQKREDVATLERRYSARIQVVINDKLMPHQSEIETRTREVMAPISVVRPGEVAAADRLPTTAVAARGGTRRTPSVGVPYARPAAASRDGAEEADGSGRRRGRRGGRGRRGEGGETPRPATEAALAVAPAPAAEVPAALAESESSGVEVGVRPYDLVGAVAGSTDVALPVEEETRETAEPATDLAQVIALEAAWIEAMPPFVPEERATNGEGASFQDQARRRRRRGGRRGARGRRAPGGAPDERREEGTGPAVDAPLVADAGDRPTPVVEGNGDSQRSSARRRRRRGGSGRRRLHEARSGGDAIETAPSAAVSAPAEPPADS